ncbi:unnamed protein product [Camellia sinensis]
MTCTFGWQAIDYARLNHSRITFFNFSKPETAASRWSRVKLNASKKEGFEREIGSAASDFDLERCAPSNGETGSATATVDGSKWKGFVLELIEEKLTNIESENKVLRQQAVSMAPNKTLSGRSRSILQRGGESGHLFPFIKPKGLSEVEDKPQKSLNEKQQENQELLIRYIGQHLGFAGNRPIATSIIYKCLLQWRSFEVERTSVFDRIIRTIGHAIEAYIESKWCRWNGRRRLSSATLFRRMTQSFRGTPQGVNLSFVNGGLTGGAEALHQVEAKYPACFSSSNQPLRFWLQNSQSTGTKNALSYILLQRKLALRLVCAMFLIL